MADDPATPNTPQRRMIDVLSQFEEWLRAEKENGVIQVTATPALVKSLSTSLAPPTPRRAAPAVRPGPSPLEQEIAFVSSEAAGSEADELLTRMIQAMGYARNQVRVEPLAADLADRLQHFQPKIIIAMGEAALRLLVESDSQPFERKRGKWMQFRNIPLMPTHAPSLLLAQPALKKEAWLDLQAALARIGKKPPPQTKK